MIEVLLATYNGQAFLAEQMNSVLAQEDAELKVLARDDGSSDDTLEILKRYAGDFPARVHILQSRGRLGGKGSFGWLLDQVQAPYVAFCDQDDVWAPIKLHALLERMQRLESELGKNMPLLVHSDLTVVDRNLKLIHPSFWSYSGINPARQHLSQILIKNTVTGCALLANRALIEKARPVPDEAAMHDHWLALVAATFGHIEAISEPLVSYRQHGNNAVGAQAYGWHNIIKRLLLNCGRMDIERLRRQASAFYVRFAKQLSPERGMLIDGFARLPERSWFGRRIFLLRHRILMPGLIRNLALFFCVRLGI
jgi:glycosyltransferase involved in cell wall biosynthesis